MTVIAPAARATIPLATRLSATLLGARKAQIAVNSAGEYIFYHQEIRKVLIAGDWGHSPSVFMQPDIHPRYRPEYIDTLIEEGGVRLICIDRFLGSNGLVLGGAYTALKGQEKDVTIESHHIDMRPEPPQTHILNVVSVLLDGTPQQQSLGLSFISNSHDPELFDWVVPFLRSSNGRICSEAYDALMNTDRARAGEYIRYRLAKLPATDAEFTKLTELLRVLDDTTRLDHADDFESPEETYSNISFKDLCAKLGLTESEATLAKLTKIFRGKDKGKTLHVAGVALGRLWSSLGDDEKVALVHTTFNWGIRSRNLNRIMSILHGLEIIGTPEAMTRINYILSIYPKGRIHNEAVLILARNGDQSGIAACIKDLKSPNVNTRNNVLKLLARYGNATAIEPLVSALHDNLDENRAEAANALGSVYSRLG
jgi:hypothetical protein